MKSLFYSLGILETGSHSVTQTSFRLALKSFCFSLPSAEITDINHFAWLK